MLSWINKEVMLSTTLKELLMRQLKRNYFWVLTILILSSTVFNLTWRDKSWPGYYTLSVFLVLIALNIIWNRYGKNESTKR